MKKIKNFLQPGCHNFLKKLTFFCASEKWIELDIQKEKIDCLDRSFEHIKGKYEIDYYHTLFHLLTCHSCICQAPEILEKKSHSELWKLGSRDPKEYLDIVEEAQQKRSIEESFKYFLLLYNKLIKIPNHFKFFNYPFVNLKYKLVFITSFVIGFVILSLLCILTGCAFFSKAMPDFPFFGKFIIWPIAFGILLPSLNCIILAFYKKVNVVFTELLTKGALTLKDEAEFKLFFESASIWNKSLTKIILVGFLSLIVTLMYWLGPTLMLKLNTWCKAGEGYSIPFFYVCFLWFIQMSIIFNVIIDFIAWTIFLKKLFKQEKNVYQFHYSDSTTGFNIFGKVALSMYTFFLALLLFTLIQLLEKFISNPELNVLQICLKYKAVPLCITSLLIILPVVFFLPLLPIHKYMIKTKQNLLEKYDNLILETHSLNLIDNNCEKNFFKSIGSYKLFMEQLKTLPTWPYDMATLRNFLMGTLSSIGLTALQFVLGF